MAVCQRPRRTPLGGHREGTDAGRDLRQRARPGQRRRGDPLRRRGRRRRRRARRVIGRPVQRQGGAGLGRLAVPRADRHRSQCAEAVDQLRSAGWLQVLAADGGGADLDELARQPVNSPVRPPGCSATRPGDCPQPTLRWPTGWSRCRSTAGPRASTWRRLLPSACTRQHATSAARRGSLLGQARAGLRRDRRRGCGVSVAGCAARRCGDRRCRRHGRRDERDGTRVCSSTATMTSSAPRWPRRSRCRTSRVAIGPQCVRPYDGIQTRRVLLEASWRATSGTEVLVTGTLVRSRPAGPVEQVALSLARRQVAPGRGPRALGPGGNRGARTALAADRGQGLHLDAAVEMGPVQRRAEAAHAAYRRRRCRPAHPADRRTAGCGQDRLRSVVDPQGTGRRHRGDRQPDRDHEHRGRPDHLAQRRRAGRGLGRPGQAVPGDGQSDRERRQARPRRCRGHGQAGGRRRRRDHRRR